jgi:predicted HTH domain antitoxin
MEGAIMVISFELPPEIAQQIGIAGTDLDREARESYLIELYRQDRISHAQLRDALGVSFFEAERVIKDHGAGRDFPLAEFEEQRAFLHAAEER